MEKKILITGLGWVTPLGCGLEAVWAALLEGRSGIAPIRGFDASSFPSRIGGEARGFDAREWMEAREARRLDRFVQFALAAGSSALSDAGLTAPFADPYRVGVLVGSGAGGLATIEEGHRLLLEKGPHRVPPLSIPRMMINGASSQLGQRFGIRGPTLGLSLACATGAASLAQAALLIRSGAADVMLAGGTEASLTPLGMAAFGCCGSLSKRNEEPERACRPFDRERDGMVMAEGAGVLVLESEEHARARGARAYAELAGWGMTSDVYHVTAPDPEGVSAARAMEAALAMAGEPAAAVGYVNAHGTSTPLNDAIESRAIRQALGPAADEVWVSSTKSMLGHQLGAAGAVEACVTALAIREGKVPPSINVFEQDPECTVRLVREAGQAMPGLRVALSNSLAFGGHNVVLAFRKCG